MTKKHRVVREALREALRAHDSAAITHMRAATKHLREGQAIAHRLEGLDKRKERK